MSGSQMSSPKLFPMLELSFALILFDCVCVLILPSWNKKVFKLFLNLQSPPVQSLFWEF